MPDASLDSVKVSFLPINTKLNKMNNLVLALGYSIRNQIFCVLKYDYTLLYEKRSQIKFELLYF